MRAVILTLFAAAALSAAAFGGQDDWPKWRGPNGDSTCKEKGLLDQWPESGPARLWSAEVGLGFACPVAADGKVYMFALAKDKDTLTAFDAEKGAVLWSDAGEGGWSKAGGKPGARATPAIDGDRIYTFGGQGDLICRDLAKGTKLWTLDVLKAAGGKPPMWGCASCPLVYGDLVIVQSGGQPANAEKNIAGSPLAVAVNKQTGKIVWQSEEKALGSYAAAVPLEAGGVKQVAVFGGKTAVGMDPASGKTLWSQPWTTTYDINAVAPTYHDGYLFITSGYGRGCAMFKFDGKKTEPLWEKKEPHDRLAPPILEGECLYLNSEGPLMCLHWPDGKVQWSQDLDLGLGGSAVRFNGDKMVILSDGGVLYLLQATPTACKVINKVPLFKGKDNWATPMIYRGRLYVKGPSELVCFDVRANGK